MAPTRSWQRSERADLHSCSVGTELAVSEAGVCATTQLSTGRACLQEARRAGSCRFASKEQVVAVLDRIRSSSVAS